MKKNQKTYEASDVYCCPITLDIIRHPVLASDGRYYELKALSEWLILHKNKGVFLKEPITSITYVTSLKETLDGLGLSEQYEDYDKELYLSSLADLIHQHYPSREQSAYKSITTAFFCLVSYLGYKSSQKESGPIQASTVLFFILAVGLTDYMLRLSSDDRYSFFSVIRHQATKVIDLFDATQEHIGSCPN